MRLVIESSDQIFQNTIILKSVRTEGQIYLTWALLPRNWNDLKFNYQYTVHSQHKNYKNYVI